MQLQQNLVEGVLYVRRCEPTAITVVDRPLRSSFLLAPDRVQEAWGPVEGDALEPSAMAPILALEPAVVLLGTGARQRFPAPAVLAVFLTRGIGVEVMDNAAAARTFNVLAGEGRRVVAAFQLPASTV